MAAQDSAAKAAGTAATSNKEIRRLQRLLKLLAHQNPGRYGDVDPGPVDGNFGAGTVRAIARFQRKIGVPENPVITRRLFAQILSAQTEEPATNPTAPASAPRAPGGCESGAACVEKNIKAGSSAEPASRERPAPSAARARRQLARFAQLGSLRDKDRITIEWNRLKKAHPDHLKDREPVIETADLGSRGTYYRILVGPFDEFSEASAFCTALRQNNQSCLVTKRPVPLPDQTASATQMPAIKAAPVKDEEPVTSSPPEATAKTVPKADRPPADPSVATTATNAPAPSRSEPSSEPAQPEPRPLAGSRGADVTASGIPNLPSATPAKDSALPANPSTPDSQASEPPNAGQAAKNGETNTGILAVATPDQASAADRSIPGRTPPATTVTQWVKRPDRIGLPSYIGPGFAAAAGACFGLFVIVWRQRRRKALMFEAILDNPWPETKGGESAPAPEFLPPKTILEVLKDEFESADLEECRRIRDTFLDSLQLPSVSAPADPSANENAMLVNRKLNQMIASDPSQYKSIFFNLIFLNHAAQRIEAEGYSLKRLDPRIQAEFQLLGSLFKLHLLELEARHHVRERLPNIFATLRQLDALA